MQVVNRNSVSAFVTKDGSTIREILAPRNSAIERQSLAEACVGPGQATQAHRHPVSEEIYYVLAGTGEMRIGDETRTVGPGDGIAIPPGAPHQIRNVGAEDLIFLCCCSPAYQHDDTEIISSLFEDL